MIAVVYDLELVKRFKKGQLSEIVEIGACKVDLESKAITDRFQIYICPSSGYVSKSTRKFISMTKEDVKTAVSFPEGISRFVEWIGEDYFLCSWGKDDRLHLLTQCLRMKVKLDWFVNYNDIQGQVGRLLREDNKQQLGLKNALELAGIEAVGQAHKGVDDALNTGLLLLKYADRIELSRNVITPKEMIALLNKGKKPRAPRGAAQTSPPAPARKQPMGSGQEKEKEPAAP